MKEHINVRQIPGESKRRWFSSEDFDLIVWFADDRKLNGFELCYDKQLNEHSISWRKDKGFSHMAIDDGEHRPMRHKSTPILVPDGYFDVKRIHAAFLEISNLLPNEIAKYVLDAIERYPSGLSDSLGSD